jgi:hypothetical protein
MRPADLVGAIANEAGIEAKSIGTIEIAEKLLGGTAGGTDGRCDRRPAEHDDQGEEADGAPRRGEPPRL